MGLRVTEIPRESRGMEADAAEFPWDGNGCQSYITVNVHITGN